MREILFRGKRVDNGEWVEGALIPILKSGHCLGSPEAGQTFIISNEDNIDCGQYWIDTSWDEIIPETLGQFTGLCDKNGKKIFEGDIVKLGTGEIRFVFYGCTSFRHTNYGKYAKEFDHKDKGYEIIGNIHDNPELLEVQDE